MGENAFDDTDFCEDDFDDGDFDDDNFHDDDDDLMAQFPAGSAGSGGSTVFGRASGVQWVRSWYFLVSFVSVL